MDELLLRGIREFNAREFFACHETLETAWAEEIGPRRVFLQSLIHFAVGFYHDQRGNPAGAASQLRKGIQKLTAYLPAWEGIDTARIYQDVLGVLERIEAGEPRDYPQIKTPGISAPVPPD